MDKSQITKWLSRLFNHKQKTVAKENAVSSYELYAKRLDEYRIAIAPYLDEPPQMEYITNEMIQLCLQSLDERGFISTGQSSSFECYLNMKGGRTPTLAYDADYVTNFRKVRAASALIKALSTMWEENYIKMIKSEAIIRIIKSYSKSVGDDNA